MLYQISFYVSNLAMGCSCHFLNRQCIKTGLQVPVARSSEWNFLHFALQVPIILRWLQVFRKFVYPHFWVSPCISVHHFNKAVIQEAAVVLPHAALIASLRTVDKEAEILNVS